MSQNGIAWLPTKEARQIAKLDLASQKRGESYNRDLLATKYVGNTVVDNPNVGGLQPHRPWTSTPTPTFSVVPRNSTVNEGGNITVDITTTNFPDGDVYFTVSGVSASDIAGGVLPSGNTTVNSGVSAVSFNMANDLTTEGTETLVFEVRTGSTSGPIVASCNVIINDTSLTPTTQSLVARQYNQNTGYATNQGTNQIAVLIADYPSILNVPDGASVTVTGQGSGTYTVSNPFTNGAVRILTGPLSLPQFQAIWGNDTLTFSWNN